MTKEQIIDGIPEILMNAKALLADANLLFKYKRFQRAYSLYQLSIEETAKAFFLIGTALFEDLSNLDTQKEINKVILSHKYKTEKSIGLQSMLNEVMKRVNMDKYEKHVLTSLDELKNVNKLNEKKNWGFYTSVVKGKFCAPEKLITEKDTIEIKSKASLRVNFGFLLTAAMTEHFDAMKNNLLRSGFDKDKADKEIITEINRIKTKYNYK